MKKVKTLIDKVWDIVEQCSTEKVFGCIHCNDNGESAYVIEDKDYMVYEIMKLISNIQKDLQHHKDTTVGLWAFDCDPKELLSKFNASQSDAHSIECGEFEQLLIDWGKYCDDKNYFKSPFFKINFQSKEEPK